MYVNQLMEYFYLKTELGIVYLVAGLDLFDARGWHFPLEPDWGRRGEFGYAPTAAILFVSNQRKISNQNIRETDVMQDNCKIRISGDKEKNKAKEI